MEALNSLLQDGRVQKMVSSSMVRGTAAIAALFIVLRFYSAKRRSPKAPKHVTVFSEIARKVNGQEGEYDADEFDVIVVGGGV